jgi:hypothetical protein
MKGWRSMLGNAVAMMHPPYVISFDRPGTSQQ